MTDEQGNLLLDEDGNPIVISISEDESIMMLHDFTTFVINNADRDDKEIIVGYVSQLLAMVFGGEDIKTNEIIEFLLSDSNTLASA